MYPFVTSLHNPAYNVLPSLPTRSHLDNTNYGRPFLNHEAQRGHRFIHAFRPEITDWGNHLISVQTNNLKDREYGHLEPNIESHDLDLRSKDYDHRLELQKKISEQSSIQRKGVTKNFDKMQSNDSLNNVTSDWRRNQGSFQTQFHDASLKRQNIFPESEMNSAKRLDLGAEAGETSKTKRQSRSPVQCDERNQSPCLQRRDPKHSMLPYASRRDLDSLRTAEVSRRIIDTLKASENEKSRVDTSTRLNSNIMVNHRSGIINDQEKIEISDKGIINTLQNPNESKIFQISQYINENKPFDQGICSSIKPFTIKNQHEAEMVKEIIKILSDAMLKYQTSILVNEMNDDDSWWYKK